MAGVSTAVRLALLGTVGALQKRDEFAAEKEQLGSTVLGQHFGSWLVYNSSFDWGDPYAFELQLVQVNEVDLTGSSLNPEIDKDPTNNAHSFQLDDERANGVQFSSPAKDSIDKYNISVSSIFLDTLLGRGQQLELSAHLLKGSGEVGPEGSTRMANAGDIYLEIKLPKWFFCGGCDLDACTCRRRASENVGSDLFGAFIDIKFEINSYNASSAMDANGGLDLGGGISLAPLTNVHFDGQESAAPAGYPKVQREGTKTVLSFRVPKFSDEAAVGAVLHMNWSADDPPWSLMDYVYLLILPFILLVAAASAVHFCCRPKPMKAQHMSRELHRVRNLRKKEVQEKLREEQRKLHEQEMQERGAARLLPGAQPGLGSRGKNSGPLGSSGPLSPPHDGSTSLDGQRPGTGKLGLLPKKGASRPEP